MAGEIIHEVQPEDTKDELTVPQFTPSVFLDVSKEQLEILEVGKTVNIKLTGKVKSLEEHSDFENKMRREIRLELKEVVIDPKENEFSELAEDD